MAVAFSSHYLSFTPRISSSPKPSKMLELKTPSFQITQQTTPLLHYKSKLGFRVVRPCFKSSVRLDESELETSSRDGSSHGKADNKQFPSLKTLIEAYKEAFLSGDEKSMSEIEEMFYLAENEKNELTKKVEAMSADIASGKEKCIRLVADFENFRKRTEKDRDKLTTNAQTEVMESLLPIVDSFEKIKQQIRPETEKAEKIDASYQGIYKQFVETMRSLNVAVVQTVGKPFDPSVHEAIAREESQEVKEGIIIQEVRRGFLLRGKLLRPAIVKVSAGPGHKKAAATTKELDEQPTAAVE